MSCYNCLYNIDIVWNILTATAMSFNTSLYDCFVFPWLGYFSVCVCVCVLLWRFVLVSYVRANTQTCVRACAHASMYL